MKFEGGGRLRTQGGEMKLDPDLHPEKKVFPLNNNRGVSLPYPSGFRPCSEQDPLFCSEQGSPWGLCRHVTPLLLFK